MPGHMGACSATIQNLYVVAIREEDDALLISGAVPGGRGGELMVQAATKVK